MECKGQRPACPPLSSVRLLPPCLVLREATHIDSSVATRMAMLLLQQCFWHPQVPHSFAHLSGFQRAVARGAPLSWWVSSCVMLRHLT